MLSPYNEKKIFFFRPRCFLGYLGKPKMNQFVSYNQSFWWTRAVWRSLAVHLGESTQTLYFKLFIIEEFPVSPSKGRVWLLYGLEVSQFISYNRTLKGWCWTDICRLGNITIEPYEKLEYSEKQTSYVKSYPIFIWWVGSLNFTILGLLCIIFILLGLLVLYHLLHQTLVEWEIRRAILGDSIVLQLLYCIISFHNKNIIL